MLVLGLLLLSTFSMNAAFLKNFLRDIEITLEFIMDDVKRSIISPDEIVTATYNEHQLELHFHQPVGSVCITVWSSGNLLIEDEQVITDNVEVPVLIPLDGFQEGDSSIEIRLENGLLYGVF